MNNLKTKLKNQTNGKKYITGLINTYSINAIVDDPDILELLQYHPTKPIDISNIDYLQVKLHPNYQRKTLYYKYRNNYQIDDISYVQCIANLFGKYRRDEQYEKDVIKAFREESNIGTKHQFFIANTIVVNGRRTGYCVNCNITTDNVSSDHYPITYQEILDKFKLVEGIILSEQDIYETSNNIIRLKDEHLSEKWRTFHDNIATYRLLCQPCNRKNGSYGYIRKT